MRDRREQLTWAELDGELTEGEARELAELRSVETDQEAGEQIEVEIRALAARLDQLEPIAPPAELRHTILAAVSKRAAKRGAQPGARSPMPTLAWFSAKARTAPVWTRWAAVAAGLTLAVIAHQLAFGPGPKDTTGLTGTVLPAPAPQEGSAATHLTTGLDFVRMRSNGDRLLAALSPGEGSATFSFRAPDLEIERLEFQDGATGSHASESGQLIVTVRGPGRVEVALRFGQPEQPFVFSAFGDGIESFEGEFTLRHETSTK